MPFRYYLRLYNLFYVLRTPPVRFLSRCMCLESIGNEIQIRMSSDCRTISACRIALFAVSVMLMWIIISNLLLCAYGWEMLASHVSQSPVHCTHPKNITIIINVTINTQLKLNTQDMNCTDMGIILK